jgi:hypothetical protein
VASRKLGSEVLELIAAPRAPSELTDDAKSERVAANAAEELAK